MEKEKLRKKYKTPSLNRPPDKGVKARRGTHIAIAKWCANWLSILQFTCLTLSFFIIALPALWSDWKNILSSTNFIAKITHDYTHLQGLAMAHLAIISALFLLKISLSGEMLGQAKQRLSYRQIMDMEAYPESKKEELAYFANSIFDTLSTTIWFILPFGLLAFAIK